MLIDHLSCKYLYSLATPWIWRSPLNTTDCPLFRRFTQGSFFPTKQSNIKFISLETILTGWFRLGLQTKCLSIWFLSFPFFKLTAVQKQIETDTPTEKLMIISEFTRSYTCWTQILMVASHKSEGFFPLHMEDQFYMLWHHQLAVSLEGSFLKHMRLT